MTHLIKIIFFLLVSSHLNANEININEVLFKINNKVFTNVDLDKRKNYIKLINNFKSSLFSEKENEEILDDYISSLIFYEYYTQNNINYKNLDYEIETLHKNNSEERKNFNETEIKNFKFNTLIDLIRKKLIEERLNSNKSLLLQEVNTNDLLYNYNVRYIIIEEKLINNDLIKNLKDRNDFNNLNKYLIENKINFFYKEEDINNNTIISNKIKKIIKKDLPIYFNIDKGYVNLISVNKSLESYEGIFVKLINFTTDQPIDKMSLKCNNINSTIDIDKTIFKEYEYSKLNNKIKNSLKSINDHILINNNNNNDYNYIILCDLTYDEKILKNINFNKNVNSLVIKIQNNFLKKYKNEYKFVKIK